MNKYDPEHEIETPIVNEYPPRKREKRIEVPYYLLPYDLQQLLDDIDQKRQELRQLEYNFRQRLQEKLRG